MPFLPILNKTVNVKKGNAVGKGILLNRIHKKPVARGEIHGGAILNASGIVGGMYNYAKGTGAPTARKPVPHVRSMPDRGGISGNSLLNEVKVPIKNTHKRKQINALKMDV